MAVKHIRRNYSEQNSPTPAKVVGPSVPSGPMKETPSRSAPQMMLKSSGQSDGNKKTWIAPVVVVVILILLLILYMRKGKSGSMAYFY